MCHSTLYNGLNLSSVGVNGYDKLMTDASAFHENQDERQLSPGVRRERHAHDTTKPRGKSAVLKSFTFTSEGQDFCHWQNNSSVTKGRVAG